MEDIKSLGDTDRYLETTIRKESLVEKIFNDIVPDYVYFVYFNCDLLYHFMRKDKINNFVKDCKDCKVVTQYVNQYPSHCKLNNCTERDMFALEYKELTFKRITEIDK